MNFTPYKRHAEKHSILKYFFFNTVDSELHRTILRSSRCVSDAKTE